MKWSRSKPKKTAEADEDEVNNITALVRQDPRTSVKTTSAHSETTNTNTQNSTIFNNNKGTVTYQTTKQTVTSRQTARITEITTRRTPTPQELEEMMRLLHMSKKTEAKTFTTSTTTTASSPLRRNRPGNLPALPPSVSNSRNSMNYISPKSATKFKSTTSPISRLIFNYESQQPGSGGASSGAGESSKTPITPTLVKTQTTTVSEKNGRTITQRVEEHRIKFDPKTFKLSTPNSPLTRNFTSEDSFGFKTNIDARPMLTLPTTRTFGTTTATTTASKTYASKPVSTYTSPYTQRELNRGAGNTTVKSNFATTASATTTKPISSLSYTTVKTPLRPTTTSSTTTTSSYNTKPTSTLFSSWEPASTPPLRKSPVPSAAVTTANKAKPATVIKTVGRTSLKPGYAYIFNSETFDNPNNEERIGSAQDVKALVQTFESYKMKTKVIENPKVDKILATVKKIETTNFDDYACLIIVILSHGSRHEEIAAKDGHYSIDDHILFPLLKNPTLNDKPKLFFIQACKGSMESSGYYKDATPFVQRGSPSEILKCYSTFEGFVSYRTEKGSIFIQTLCQQLKQSGGHTNIKAIMDMVITSVKEQTQNKQIPSYSSTLTKPFVIGDYLKK